MNAWRHVALAALNSQRLANAPEVTSRARIEVRCRHRHPSTCVLQAAQVL